MTDKTQWFVLAEKTDEIPEFADYTARKVNVNELKNNDKVVVYFSIHDDENQTDTYYAVKYDGSLVKIDNTGDTVTYFKSDHDSGAIEWLFNGPGASDYPYTFTDYQPQDQEQRTPRSYLYPDGTEAVSTSDLSHQIALPGINDGTYGSPIVSEGGRFDFAIGYDKEHNRLVTVPESDSSKIEFLYAVVEENPNPLNTVDTIDTRDYINITMYDFGGTTGTGYRKDMGLLIGSSRTDNEENISGEWRDGPADPGEIVGVLLGEDGFPTLRIAGTGGTTTMKTLFEQNHNETNGKVPKVSNLFLQSWYDETGYYHYCSEENYAYLDGDSFIVYDAVGIPSDNNANPAYNHGNFMPYNSIVDTGFSPKNYYLFDEDGKQLELDDPSITDKLYLLPDPDYYFGMTMEAEFYQPKDGKVNGEDMVFKFNGDDDMFLYIDGVLILDIGGIHDPRSGWIDFSTGKVYMQDIPTIGPYAGVFDPVTHIAYLDALFTAAGKDTSGFDGHTFKDYSGHKLNMFYMERGDGASNLDINFNLTFVEPGTFSVKKTVSSSVNYQNNYGSEESFEFIAYAGSSSDNLEVLRNHKYVLTRKDNSTVELQTDENGKFTLKADEIAKFSVTDGSVHYYVQEVNINSSIYEVYIDNSNRPVSLNNSAAQSTEHRADEHPLTEYDNRVKQTGTLEITKNLNDDNSQYAIARDNGTFSYKVQLQDINNPGSGNSINYINYNKGDYYIKKDNQYYTYDSVSRELVPSGKAIAGQSNSDGIIANIPAGYTVEIDNLLLGTGYKIVEETVPANYAWESYSGGTSGSTQADGVTGTVGDPSSTPIALVSNVGVLNKMLAANVKVIKVDGGNVNTKLSGATFTLAYWNGSTFTNFLDGNADKTFTTNDNGELTIEKLPRNQYYHLTETNPPVGYVLTGNKDIYFKINENGEVSLTDADRQPIASSAIQDNTLAAPNISQVDQANYNVTVPNTPGAELPMTGGPGTKLFTILGSILMCLGGALLFRRRQVILNN